MHDHATEMPSAAVTRRRFLGTAGATGVGLGLGSGLLTSACPHGARLRLRQAAG